jgi:hypothetical protein
VLEPLRIDVGAQEQVPKCSRLRLILVMLRISLIIETVRITDDFAKFSLNMGERMQT